MTIIKAEALVSVWKICILTSREAEKQRIVEPKVHTEQYPWPLLSNTFFANLLSNVLDSTGAASSPRLKTDDIEVLMMGVPIWEWGKMWVVEPRGKNETWNFCQGNFLRRCARSELLLMWILTEPSENWLLKTNQWKQQVRGQLMGECASRWWWWWWLNWSFYRCHIPNSDALWIPLHLFISSAFTMYSYNHLHLSYLFLWQIRVLSRPQTGTCFTESIRAGPYSFAFYIS